jgi:uncharacterized membrane protein
VAVQSENPWHLLSCHVSLTTLKIEAKEEFWPLIAGALVGGTAGVIGAFAGYGARGRFVNKRHIHDLVVAVCEDLFAIGLGFSHSKRIDSVTPACL